MPVEFDEKGNVIKSTLASLNEENLEHFVMRNDEGKVEGHLDETANFLQSLDCALYENAYSTPEPRSAWVAPRNLSTIKKELEKRKEVLAGQMEALNTFIEELDTVIGNYDPERRRSDKPITVVKRQAHGLLHQKTEFLEKINYPLPEKRFDF